MNSCREPPCTFTRDDSLTQTGCHRRVSFRLLSHQRHYSFAILNFPDAYNDLLHKGWSLIEYLLQNYFGESKKSKAAFGELLQVRVTLHRRSINTIVILEISQHNSWKGQTVSRGFKIALTPRESLMMRSRTSLKSTRPKRLSSWGSGDPSLGPMTLSHLRWLVREPLGKWG